MAGPNRLVLGPVVGHTDFRSSRVWIEVAGDPADYTLRVQGAGQFAFVSTEAPGPLEFRTAIAIADGLRADWQYRYTVLRRGKAVADGRGTFRTMPDPGSQGAFNFVAISCNVKSVKGAWPALAKYIADTKPRFLLMCGDQLYLDEGGIDLFSAEKRKLSREKRRAAIAEKYRLHWSLPETRDVLANIPVYMVNDDHDIRDGWGSSASDSPTMVGATPAAKPSSRSAGRISRIAATPIGISRRVITRAPATRRIRRCLPPTMSMRPRPQARVRRCHWCSGAGGWWC
ncbi:hypothetical protein GCM10011529_03610 [Polymorphobacter glacialis]|uniref:PhoD-like phosphatase metallophosphatase domain-containing protein n=1 Tax=Sandarakinorhabdus glacialis TaxID=1614636 RepID=A0A917E3P4_9SPHN|nr:alkaline phosphatase D family protein [Polymorphobacter glacialis]GGE00631.1 hypothetical protein GCM10011529_03610 [Polymorphobacter glacialis]